MAKRIVNKKEKAFTFAELIVVILFVALIAGVGLASFSSILTPNRLEANARKIAADLSWARDQAVAKRQNCRIYFDTANDTYTVYLGSEAIKRENLEVDLVSLSFFPSEFTFSFPQGTTQSGIITLSYMGDNKQIQVFGETGYIKIL